MGGETTNLLNFKGNIACIQSFHFLCFRNPPILILDKSFPIKLYYFSFSLHTNNQESHFWMFLHALIYMYTITYPVYKLYVLNTSQKFHSAFKKGDIFSFFWGAIFALKFLLSNLLYYYGFVCFFVLMGFFLFALKVFLPYS